MLVTILQKSAIFALVAVSMNLVNGFTGLFSLGQAGFMSIGAYVTAILTIPLASRPTVYYLVDELNPIVQNVQLPFPVAIILGGLIAAFFAALIGIPVLRLKSDYLAIATLGFSEIIRALINSQQLQSLTNGSYGLNQIPALDSTVQIFFIVGVCIAIMVLVLRSSYGRAFKAIREDEIAAEAMGINLFKHKEMAFVISSFFTAIGGGLLAMFMRSVSADTFKIAMTYDVLLIVVIGGMGSVTGSILSSFLVTASKEWWLTFLDKPLTLFGWQVPLFKTGFRMVVFSVLLMVVVLFYRKGLMGNREFSWDAVARFPRKIASLFRRKKKEEVL